MVVRLFVDCFVFVGDLCLFGDCEMVVELCEVFECCVGVGECVVD